MKAKMTFDAMLDKMDAALPYVAAILNDDEVGDVRKGIFEHKDELRAGETVLKMFPLMMTKHRKELYHIIAITKDMDAEDVPKMDMNAAKEALKSSIMADMLDFFPWLLQTVLRS